MKRFTTVLLTMLLSLVASTAFAQDLEGDYLIVNTETGNYLGGGLTWGTQASEIGKPQFINFEVQSDGTYKLDSHQYNSETNHYLGSDLYFDNSGVNWTVEEVNGGYTFYNSAAGGYLVGNGFQTAVSTSSRSSNATVWRLVTLDEVVASMTSATERNPVDVTALIKNPELKRNSNSSYYQTWDATNVTFGGGQAVANCAEAWNLSSFSAAQVISLPLAGTYVLSAQGFSRNGSNGTGTYDVSAQMYMDETAVDFPILNTSANTMAEAYAEFLQELHSIDPITLTLEKDNGEVEIGFKGSVPSSSWAIFGELTLMYYGSGQGAKSGTVVHDCVAELDHWSISPEPADPEHFVLNTWSTEGEASGMVTPFLEYWKGTGTTLTDAIISHETLEDLDDGYYVVSIDARAFNEGSTTDVEAGTILFNANGQSVDLTTGTENIFEGESAEYYGTYNLLVEVTDGTLDINFTVEGTNCDWLSFKNLKVTYLGETPVLDYVTGDMNAELEAAMESAVDAWNESLSDFSLFNAAEEALAAAEESVVQYAEIAALAGNLDADGAAVWSESASGQAYAAKTLTTSDDFSSDMSAAQLAQTTSNSDMTFALVNSGEWTAAQGKGPSSCPSLTTATETYNDSGDYATGKVLYKTVSGLQEGMYTVSFYAQANAANVTGLTSGDGIAQAYANDKVDDITVGTLTNLGNEWPDGSLHTMTCTVGSDGVLEFGLQNVADGGNWYVAEADALTLNALSSGEDYAYDVTWLVTNPSFELDNIETLEYDETRGAYIVDTPTGWTLMGDPSVHDIMTKDATATDNNFGAPGEPSDGTQMLYLRNSWEDDKAVTLLQSVTLPVGYYKLTVDSKCISSSGSTAQLVAGGESVDLTIHTDVTEYAAIPSEWDTAELTFYLTAETTLDLGIDIVFNGANGSFLLDNFQLWSTTEIVEPKDIDGDYLVMNGGLYFGTGLTNNRQATMLKNPMYIGFEKQSDGTYLLDSYEYNWVSSGSSGQHYFGHSGTLAGICSFASSEDSWKVEAQSDGTFTIYCVTSGYEGYVTSNGEQQLITLDSRPSKGSYWTLMTKKEFIETLAEATEDEPVDASALILFPDFKTYSNYADKSGYEQPWLVADGEVYVGVDHDASSFGNAAESYWEYFNLFQDVTLPYAGTYTLTAQGFSRTDGDYYEQPYFYVTVGGKTTSVPISDLEDDSSITTLAEASDAFYEGLYPIGTLTVEATSDNTDITIGFRGGEEEQWVAFSQVVLTYYGASEVKPEPEEGAYQFVNEMWVASDDNRAPASSITYNDDNTITVAASGANNIALGNSSEKSQYGGITTADMVVSNAQNWFIVVATDVSTENDPNNWTNNPSFLWWLNGCNYGTQVPATLVAELADGRVAVAWDVTLSGIDENLKDVENFLNGWTCFGLTSTTGTSVISDISFYTWDEAVAKYPELGNVATGIASVETAVGNDAIYTLSGVRVSKATKGVYIVNGKKVLVK